MKSKIMENKSSRPFMLTDEQIFTHRQTDLLPVMTHIHGGTCTSKDECEDAGGEWVKTLHGQKCDGAQCSDSGTGDWD